MSKYSRDLSDDLVKLVEDAVAKAGLEQLGIRVEAIRLNKSKNAYGEVLKGNDLVKLFTNGEDVIAVALFEDLFDRLDEKNKKLLIESLVAQISYDFDKDKLVITKPELNVPLGMYRKYGTDAVSATEMALMTVEQINEEKKAEKEAKKASKSKNS